LKIKNLCALCIGAFVSHPYKFPFLISDTA